MKTVVSKFTKKYQATVPDPVRKKLNLSAGDTITFAIDEDVVRLRKATPVDIEFSKALVPTLDEWNSVYDEEAYGSL